MEEEDDIKNQRTVTNRPLVLYLYAKSTFSWFYT